MGDSQKERSVFFAEAASLPETSFAYGWCTTDDKNGKAIRRDYRSADYLNDEPYATSVKAMLEKLGLPFPKPEEIFRGTRHDLLFLNSHGVVVRIGPTDVEDMLNPAIIQPLGWLEDTDIRIGKIPLALVINPGIEQYAHWRDSNNPPESVGNLRKILKATEQGDGDVSGSLNKGIIRILDDAGAEAAVEILLDADNELNYSSRNLTVKRSESLARAAAFLENKGDILSHTIESVFGATENIKYWQRAFEAHQPLRRLFWDAFSNVDTPDAAAVQKFWDTCAQVTNNPQAAVVPGWHAQTKANGEPAFVREEVFVPQVVLYRPWTGQPADKVVHPVQVSPALRQAVEKEHEALMQKKNPKSKTSGIVFHRGQ